MSYTSGDWTARQRYLLSSSLCFPQEDANALLEFTNGLRSHAISDISDGISSSFTNSYSSTSSMPFFPIYNGTPASMTFGSASNIDLMDSAILCTAMLSIDNPGKLAIWANIDAESYPFKIELVLNGTVVAKSSTSPYIIFGTAEQAPPGIYSAALQCSSVGFLTIKSASIMIVGGLS